MYKLFTINNKKKSDIKGFWQDKNKIYIDNIFLKDCQDLKELNSGIKDLFNKNELSVFYTKNKKGYILDNQSKKIRLNDKLVYNLARLRISRIKQLIKKYNGLTIYRKRDLENNLFYTIEIFHNRLWNKSIKEKKQKELIKKLFKNYVKKLSIEKLPIKIRVTKSYISFSKTWNFHYNNKPAKNFVNIGLKGIKYFSKKGYSDSYYNGRHEYLNFLIGNKHLHLRFVILHELKHSIDRLTENEVTEKNADIFAIEKLKEFGELKI